MSAARRNPLPPQSPNPTEQWAELSRRLTVCLRSQPTATMSLCEFMIRQLGPERAKTVLQNFCATFVSDKKIKEIDDAERAARAGQQPAG